MCWQEGVRAVWKEIWCKKEKHTLLVCSLPLQVCSRVFESVEAWMTSCNCWSSSYNACSLIRLYHNSIPDFGKSWQLQTCKLSWWQTSRISYTSDECRWQVSVHCSTICVASKGCVLESSGGDCHAGTGQPCNWWADWEGATEGEEGRSLHFSLECNFHIMFVTYFNPLIMPSIWTRKHARLHVSMPLCTCEHVTPLAGSKIRACGGYQIQY